MNHSSHFRSRIKSKFSPFPNGAGDIINQKKKKKSSQENGQEININIFIIKKNTRGNKNKIQNDTTHHKNPHIDMRDKSFFHPLFRIHIFQINKHYYYNEYRIIFQKKLSTDIRFAHLLI